MPGPRAAGFFQRAATVAVGAAATVTAAAFARTTFVEVQRLQNVHELKQGQPGRVTFKEFAKCAEAKTTAFNHCLAPWETTDDEALKNFQTFKAQDVIEKAAANQAHSLPIPRLRHVFGWALNSAFSYPARSQTLRVRDFVTHPTQISPAVSFFARRETTASQARAAISTTQVEMILLVHGPKFKANCYKETGIEIRPLSSRQVDGKTCTLIHVIGGASFGPENLGDKSQHFLLPDFFRIQRITKARLNHEASYPKETFTDCQFDLISVRGISRQVGTAPEAAAPSNSLTR